MINDPELAAAHQAGVGAVIEGTLGGLGDGMPMAGRFRVDCLSDGCFPFTGDVWRVCCRYRSSAVLAIAEDDVDIRIVISSSGARISIRRSLPMPVLIRRRRQLSSRARFIFARITCRLLER